jgi:hypothetical protein
MGLDRVTKVEILRQVRGARRAIAERVTIEAVVARPHAHGWNGPARDPRRN